MRRVRIVLHSPDPVPLSDARLRLREGAARLGGSAAWPQRGGVYPPARRLTRRRGPTPTPPPKRRGESLVLCPRNFVSCPRNFVSPLFRNAEDCGRITVILKMLEFIRMSGDKNDVLQFFLGNAMEPSLTDWIQAGAAALTLLAAIVAAIIALKAPRMAAKYAEEYRRENVKIDDQSKLQTDVFRALMKGRSEILAPDSRAAINLVEVAFPDNADVRNARRMFTVAARARPFDANQMVKSYFDLIESVSKAIGASVDRFDIESGYYPEALGKIDEAAVADAEMKLALNAKPPQ